VSVYRETEKHFPPDERFVLITQMRSAAGSVTADIADGTGRRSLQDLRTHSFITQGSPVEVENYLHLADRLGYLPEDVDGMLALRDEVGKILHGLIKRSDSQIPTSKASQSQGEEN
jgi:four helix bundle protein